MSAITIIVGAVLFNLLLILFVKLDLSAFADAAMLAEEQGRRDEWLAQRGRLFPGSGFRLLKHFKKPVTTNHP